MFDDDDDAEDPDAEDPFSDRKENKAMSNRESRKEREAKLKQMMEDDDGMLAWSRRPAVANVY